MTLGDRPGLAVTERAHAVAAAVERLRSAQPAIGRPVPAHASVLVPFDPLAIPRAEAHRHVAFALEAGLAAAASRPERDDPPVIEIAVRYGGDDGPDLDEVAARLRIRPSDVRRRHAGATYRVLFLGFAPGFAYLGGLPPELATPRRQTPRERVPAGSVAIAGEQTAVYPLSMPGGWNLIGRTDATLFDAAAAEPTPLLPGAIVRFVDVG